MPDGMLTSDEETIPDIWEDDPNECPSCDSTDVSKDSEGLWTCDDCGEEWDEEEEEEEEGLDEF